MIIIIVKNIGIVIFGLIIYDDNTGNGHSVMTAKFGSQMFDYILINIFSDQKKWIRFGT